MKLWIVTIGSSDVQLDSNKVSREKKRKAEEYSADVWGYWYNEKIQYDFCNGMLFEPKRVIDTLEETYRIPSRVLGTVYEENSAEVQEEIWSYLTFPLLEQFTERLKSLGVPDAIAYLLTDQSAIFDSEEERRKPKSPYWDDTCKLQPILERYFQKEFTDKVKLISLKLSPPSEYGLDDWNKVLGLVQDELKKIQDELKKIQDELKKIQLDSKLDTVYVSHQAGTPAISSAVQFMSLARFRENVKFLVSSEHSQETKTIHNSTYLGALQRQEAIALLEQHDYVGIRDLLGLGKKNNPSNEKEKNIKYLLDAAEQWNYAEFQKFKKILTDRKLLAVPAFPWYQSGYESAYLAWIRLEQGSTVDAMFHSFRAVEGSICKWVEKRYDAHIFKDPKYGPQVKLSIRQELPGYFNALSPNSQKKFEQYGKIGLYGDPVYDLFKQARPESKNCPDIKVVWEVAKDERNNLFHRLDGLQESELFDAWNTKTKDEWKKRLLGCMNFIAQPDLSKAFTSLEEASLMAQVHQKLTNLISSYQPE